MKIIKSIANIVILLAALAATGFVAFFGILVMTCGKSSAGVLFFIPLIILIIFFISNIRKAIFGKKEVVSENKKITLDNNQQAVLDYINQAKNRGMADMEITNALLGAGWKEDFIADIYKIMSLK